MSKDIEFKQLKDITLNTVDEVHALFPHWKRASVQKKIKATNSRRDKRFVALSNGKIVAHVRVVNGRGLHKHRVEITSLIVEPKCRRKHIGTDLMKFVLSELPKERRLVLLAVDVKNSPAIELYKKLGFEEYGLLKKASKINDKFVDNCLMRKER
jgi:ribosomal protein S18 acetylase RimI-like enzyme